MHPTHTQALEALIQEIRRVTALGHQTGPYAYAGENFGKYLADATKKCEEALTLLSALTHPAPSAAEPVAWQVKTDAGLWGQPFANPRVAEDFRRAGRREVRNLYAAPPAPQAPSEPALRRLLALAHCCSTLYTDDGELSDCSVFPDIDFKRDSVEVIEQKLKERAARKLAASPTLPEAPAPQAKSDVGEREVAHVGDTRFEGWLSEHQISDVQGSKLPMFHKQDLRDAYWAGYSERAALQPPASAPVAEAVAPCSDSESIKEIIRAGCLEILGRSASPEAAFGFGAGAKWAVDALRGSEPVALTDEQELRYCNHCQGSGESTHMVGSGPDIHEEPCNCDKCEGTGIFQAGRVVDVGLLEYRGNSVSYIHSKMTVYGSAIDAAWAALKTAGVKPDGHTSIADGIARLAAHPSPVAEEAKDAARYRWLREHRDVTLLTAFFGNGCVNKYRYDIDAHIDAALSQGGGS